MAEKCFKVQLPDVCGNVEAELIFDEDNFPKKDEGFMVVGTPFTGCKPKEIEVTGKTKKFTRTWTIEFKPRTHKNHVYPVKVLSFRKTIN